MDKLKKYIEQKRSEMDVDLPPAAVWENIQNHTTAAVIVKPVYRLVKYLAAAVIIILAGTGIWLITKKEKSGSPTISDQNQTPAQKDTEEKNIEFDSGADKPVPQVASANPKERRSQIRQRSKPSLFNSNDLETIDKTYSRLVSYQMERLRATPVYAESPAYFSQFVSQLEQMESDEEKMKEEVEQFGLNDQILEGLITIYQNKLSLLKTLQKEIRKMNGIVNKTRPKEKLQAYYLNL